MQDAIKDTTPTLQCRTCDRIFTNEKTKSRHRFYCRSKIAKGHQRLPKRSCLSCVRAKVRCDFTAGKCARCKLKGLSCEWPQRKGYLPSAASDLSGRSAKKPGTTFVLNSSPLPLVNNEQEVYLRIDSTINDKPRNSNDTIYTFSNGTDFTGIPSPLATVGSASDSYSTTLSEDVPDLEVIARRLAIYGAPFSSFQLTETAGLDLPLPSQPISTTNDMLAFQYRTYSDPVQSNSAATLARILSSYPTMLLRRETFPPFIHQHCVPGDEQDPQLLHPLLKCMEISHSFKYRTPESSELVWNSIKAEHERLIAERTKYSIWELLAGFQSLLIYVIMRLVEGEKDYTDFDALLLVSMNLICSQMTDAVGGFVLEEEVTGKNLSWKNWLFAESRRRTMALYRVIGMCMHLETAKSCRPQPGFLDAPLPAATIVWSAPDAAVWEKEYEYSLKQRGSEIMPSNGMLILMHAGAFRNNHETVWDDWFAGIDGLGTLIVIAASMVI